MFKSRQRGFTLLELMIVVVVVAILAAVAIPTFLDQLRKSRRSDAMRGLSDLQMREERWRASNATYASSMDVLLGSAAATTSYNNGSAYYSFSISGTSGTGFTVNATPKGAQTADTDCNPMQLQVAGGVVTKLPISGCWK
jgi:type IV pilus assembly protein PilE